MSITTTTYTTPTAPAKEEEVATINVIGTKLGRMKISRFLTLQDKLNSNDPFSDTLSTSTLKEAEKEEKNEKVEMEEAQINSFQKDKPETEKTLVENQTPRLRGGKLSLVSKIQ